MNFLKRIFNNAGAGGKPDSQPASQLSLPASAQHTRSPMSQENSARRELLRLVLGDTLNRAGIPTAWIDADLLGATSRGRTPGIHVRLLLKHWDPRLIVHGIAFEHAFKKRVLTLDPAADQWLLGISWQFSLDDESACPPMPHPGIWTSSIPQSLLKVDELAQQTAMTAPDPTDLLGGSIVISGPAATPAFSAARPAAAGAISQASRQAAPLTDARAEAKADLERLFAIRDDDLQRHANAAGSPQQFAATEPAGLDALASARPNDTEAGPSHPSFAKTDFSAGPT